MIQNIFYDCGCDNMVSGGPAPDGTEIFARCTNPPTEVVYVGGIGLEGWVCDSCATLLAGQGRVFRSSPGKRREPPCL